MKLKNKFLIIILLISVILNLTITSFAEIQNTSNTTDSPAQIDTNNENTELKLYCNSCILVECSTNKIAYEKNADTVTFPASTTKLLTAILAIEKCNLTDKITITNEMVSKIPSGYTTAYLESGEILTVEQLLNALLIPSANDAGFALAIHISGSVENFSNLMNEKAKEIGCTNSNFTNPSGIHDEKHVSTAKDLAIIGTYALKYSQITEICSKTSYTLHPENSYSRTFETTNTLLKQDTTDYYEHATGLKTGFTAPAGSCIIATAEQDNKKFLVVVLGAPQPEETINYRDQDCKTLFEYGFLNYDEIIKINQGFVDFLKNFLHAGSSLSLIFKSALVIFTIFLFCLLLKRKKKSITRNFTNNLKNKLDLFTKKNNRNNSEDDEFNFRCSFW